MSRIVVTEFMTLDGVIESPMWSLPYWNDNIAGFKGEETEASEAMLLGRITYEGFAAAWPNSKDEGAPAFNAMRKYVVSNNLKTADWNNSVIIRGDVVGELKRLKEQPGGNLTVHGSGKLIDFLVAHDLVDEYRFLVYPVVLGQGQRLFTGVSQQVKLTLLESREMGGGVVALRYEPARA